MLIDMCSGISRSLRAATRPSIRPRAAIKQNFLPAFSARFASTDSAKDGKIHQVIGAVVDGIEISPYQLSMALKAPALLDGTTDNDDSKIRHGYPSINS
jgi:hypothetical protein